MTFFASSCPITYWSRRPLISLGRINLRAAWIALFFLCFSSSANISPACCTHRSQICAPSPAISIWASFLLMPQNEQWMPLRFDLPTVLIWLPSSVVAPHLSYQALSLRVHASNSRDQMILQPIYRFGRNVQQ